VNPQLEKCWLKSGLCIRAVTVNNPHFNLCQVACHGLLAKNGLGSLENGRLMDVEDNMCLCLL
jgi:hypothetical protein